MRTAQAGGCVEEAGEDGLQRGGGACFDATYGTSTRNTAGQFSAKAD
jgi:hypothetical protein